MAEFMWAAPERPRQIVPEHWELGLQGRCGTRNADNIHFVYHPRPKESRKVQAVQLHGHGA